MTKTPEGYDELIAAVSDQTARDIIAYRKKISKPLTARAARKIASELAKVPEDERDAAVDTWFNRAWRGFEAAWLIPKPFPGQKQQTGGAPRSFDHGPSNVVIRLPENHFSKRWERGEFKKKEA